MVDKLEACARCGQHRDGHIDRIDARPGQCDAWQPTPANGEQVERVAKAIRPLIETDGEIYWASEYGRPVPQESVDAIARAAIAAMNPTPTEDARSRVKVLEEAARPIVAKLEHSEASFARYRAVHPYEDDINGDDGVCVSVADLRALRTALAQ